MLFWILAPICVSVNKKKERALRLSLTTSPLLVSPFPVPFAFPLWFFGGLMSCPPWVLRSTLVPSILSRYIVRMPQNLAACLRVAALAHLGLADHHPVQYVHIHLLSQTEVAPVPLLLSAEGIAFRVSAGAMLPVTISSLRRGIA